MWIPVRLREHVPLRRKALLKSEVDCIAGLHAYWGAARWNERILVVVDIPVAKSVRPSVSITVNRVILE